MINFVGSALAIVLCLLSMPAPMVQAATHQKWMPPLKTILEERSRLAWLAHRQPSPPT